MTSRGFAAPFRVPVTHAGTKGQIVLDQLRTVDKLRLVKKRCTCKDFECRVGDAARGFC